MAVALLSARIDISPIEFSSELVIGSTSARVLDNRGSRFPSGCMEISRARPVSNRKQARIEWRMLRNWAPQKIMHQFRRLRISRAWTFVTDMRHDFSMRKGLESWRLFWLLASAITALNCAALPFPDF